MDKGALLFFIVWSMTSSGFAQEDILLKNYDPISVYNVPKTIVKKAKFSIVDMHSHAYAKTPAEIADWVTTMDAKGIEKTVILSSATGKKFDNIYRMYSKHGDRFDVWCGIDLEGYDNAGWSKKAVKELERCFEMGAKGVGEVTDKGEGLQNSLSDPARGMHFTDDRMKPILKKCGELGLPINIHVAEPYWMYLSIDVHNDGMMNAQNWKIDTSKRGIWLHEKLIASLETIVRDNPETTIIACHFANCGYDLRILGKLFDNYGNLYADIAARYAEVAPVPKHTKAFYVKYQDRLLYGTDMGFDDSMYQITFRMLETDDEHFYEKQLFGYHWPLYGLGLPDDVLKKVYHENAKKILDAAK